MRTDLRALGLGIAGSVAFAGAAAAADFYTPSPVQQQPFFAAAPAFSWAGGYAGLQGGWNWVNTDSGAPDLNGPIAGLYAGWNWQADAFVYGVEANLNYSWADANLVGGGEVEAGLQGNVRARLGVALADRWLAYGTAGIAIGRFSLDAPGISDSDTSVGFTVGAGVEWAFANNTSARLDYTYSDFDINLGGGPSVDASSHTLMLGLAWKM